MVEGSRVEGLVGSLGVLVNMARVFVMVYSFMHAQTGF
jgi:hypothetical protein